MKMYADQDIKKALTTLKNDGVKVTIEKSGKGDQSIIIHTPHYTLMLGVNDLGVWLEDIAKHKEFVLKKLETPKPRRRKIRLTST